MSTPQDSALGRHVDYPREYDASVLFPIARSLGRDAIGIDTKALPFAGFDRNFKSLRRIYHHHAG